MTESKKQIKNLISPVTQLRRRGLLDQASQTLQKLHAKNGKSVDFLLEKLFVDIENRIDKIKILGDCQTLEKENKLSDAQQVTLLIIRGVAFNRDGQPDVAQNLLFEAIEKLRSIEEQEHLIAEALDHLGNVQTWVGDFKNALTSFSRATSILINLDDTEGLARNQGNLGRAYLEFCQYKYAAEFLDKALSIQQQWGSSRELVRLEENMAQALNGLGDHRRAYELATKALNQAKGTYDDYLTFTCMREQTIGAIGAELAYPKGLVDTLVKIAGDKDSYEKASAQLVEGQFLLSENAEKAVDVLLKARAWFVDGSNTVPIIKTEQFLTMAYLSLNENSKAAHILMIAINRAKKNHFDSLERELRELQIEHDLFDGIPFEKGKTFSKDRNTAAGGYLVRESLGSGAFGSVDRAYDMEKGQDVALKTIKLANLYDTQVRNDLIQSARRELAATAQINHPGISKVYALGEKENGDFYVVQELIKGKTLRQVIGEGVPSLEQFTQVMNGVAHALGALHEVKVLHRDLKPENVIIKDDGSPVLIDFGISHVPKDYIDVEVKSGSGAYMAPEVILGKPQEVPLDVYAWGVMAYEWLVGERPFEHPSERVGFFKRFGEQGRLARILKKSSPDFPKGIHSLIIRSFAFTYTNRPQSSKELILDVE
jgi:serine/threonine-protein kinase